MTRQEKCVEVMRATSALMEAAKLATESSGGYHRTTLAERAEQFVRMVERIGRKNRKKK